MCFQWALALLLSLHVFASHAQLASGGQSAASGQSSGQQYPRIRLGGPLGQLMPDGFQLGHQLGSLVNQLIGTAESNAIPAPANWARAPFIQQHAQQTHHAQQQQHAPSNHKTSPFSGNYY